MKKKMKRFDEGGWAGDDVGKGAATRRLQAANSATPEEQEAVSNLKIETEPRIGPVKNYPKGRDFDSDMDEVNYAAPSRSRSDESAISKVEESSARPMPTRPGQNVSGVMPVKKSVGVAASETPAGNPKLNSLQGHKPRNFDPAWRSSEAVGDKQLATLNKQLKKAPTENAARMAARQAFEKKAANTAADQAIIDRMSKRTKPYMKDEAGNDMKRGGSVKKMASGGSTSSASRRADGIAQRGKTRGKMC
jgi:hypothetical protein